jgi:MFS transporter, DHA3 family, macrolide efflux protein
MTNTSPKTSLLVQHDFRLLLLSWGISSIGAGMQFIATSWLATELSGKGYAAALVLIVQTIPGLLFAPFLGVWIDRLERRKLAAFIDGFRAVGLMIVPFVYWFGTLESWHLYAMTFVVALADSVFWTTRGALLREVIAKDRLLEGNTISMTVTQIGMIVGASLSGFVIAGTSPITAIVVNASTYLISCLLTLGMRVKTVREERAQTSSYRQELQAGWRYLRSQPGLWFPYFGGLLLFSTVQTVNVLLVPFVKNVLGLKADSLGLIDAAWAVGAVIAGFVIGALVKKFGREKLMMLSPLAVAGALIVFSLSNSFWLAFVSFAFAGLFIRGNVLYRTTAQERTNLDFQGRVESIVGVVSSLISLLIYVLMGALQEFVSIRVLYWLQSLVLLALAVWAWRNTKPHVSRNESLLEP